MDIKSFNRWDEYTAARDAMFAATDTARAPWFVARSENKKRVRLNIITHLLSQILWSFTGGACDAAEAQNWQNETD